MQDNNSAPKHPHGHLGAAGFLGMAAGLGLMIYVPSLRAVARVSILYWGFLLVGAVVLLASFYAMAGRGIARHLAHARGPAVATKFDFGWAPGMTIGPWTAALIAVSTAVAVQVAAPTRWPLAFLLVLIAAGFFIGYLIARSASRPDQAVLPLVDWLSGESDFVLDGGCGAGRTTLAVGRVLKQGRIVALDRFDADYIAGGGRTLLEQNLRLAGLTGRVRIEQGDLIHLPFPDQTFDSAVSTHAMDHLGPQKEQGLREMLRILKPGGRFLLVVWVPGWVAFTFVNVLSFFLTTRSGWKRLAVRAGFNVADEGMWNGLLYLVLQRPAPKPS